MPGQQVVTMRGQTSTGEPVMCGVQITWAG
jgi:hypothetical protein